MVKTTGKCAAKTAVEKLKKSKLQEIRKRFDDADLGPLRAKKERFGWTIIEPYGVWGRHDIVYAHGLDGYSAAFFCQAPEDIRWLLEQLENG